ncbi:MAG: TonB-dependent receptor [Pseudomonadota bacterium]
MQKILLASGAVALVAAAPAAAAVLDEVVVTATKRQESLRDVPVSVAAVTTETLNDMGVVDIEDVALYIPNFEASVSTILPNLYVRGLGTGTSHSIEQPVGRFVDDVYIGRGAASMLGFLDVEAVEILRGPQGTLFGKNTLAGAMVIRTGNPTDELTSRINLGYGSYSTDGNFFDVDGVVSGPLTDSLRARLALRYADSDGYIENRLNGPDGGIREDFGVRLKLEQDIGDNTTWQLKLEHGEYDAEGNTSLEIVGPPESNPGIANAFQFLSPGWTGELDWAADYACNDDAPVVHSLPGFCPDRDQEVQAAVFRVAHDFTAGEFLSISGYQRYEFLDRFYAIDMGIAGGSYNALRDEDYESISQEFRFTSETGGVSDYIVGFYYEKSDLFRYSNTDFDLTRFPGLPLLLQQNEVFDQETETMALFGQYRYRFNDDYTLVLGGRFTDEEKTYQFSRSYEPFGTPYDPTTVISIGQGPFGPLEAAIDRPVETRSESRFTPSVTLQWDASDSLMLFGTLSQGYKAGGFSDRVTGNPADSIQFEEEVNNAAEIGMKGLFLDGTLELNVALFYMQIDDLQVSSSVPGTISFQVQNAAEAISRGVEVDGRWSLGRNWLIGGNLAYTDAYYDSFPGADCTPGQAAAAGPGCTQDLTDQTLIFAPDWKGTLYGEYTTELGGGWELQARGDVTYSDEYFTETPLSPGVYQGDYQIYNLSVWLTSPDGRYRIGAIGRNLTEEAYRTFGLASPGSSVYLAEPNLPRRISLNFSANF